MLLLLGGRKLCISKSPVNQGLYLFSLKKTWANLSSCIKPADLYWNNTTVIQTTQGWIKGSFLFANIRTGSHMCNFLRVSQKECLLSSWPSQGGAELCFFKSLMSGIAETLICQQSKLELENLRPPLKLLIGRNNLRAKMEQQTAPCQSSSVDIEHPLRQTDKFCW